MLYHGLYSKSSYMHESSGEWKHGERIWRRHLCNRLSYNDKFYGNDCVIGRADVKVRDQHEG